MFQSFSTDPLPHYVTTNYVAPPCMDRWRSIPLVGTQSTIHENETHDSETMAAPSARHVEFDLAECGPVDVQSSAASWLQWPV
ncbi:MAG: hypothetical protein ACI8Y4_001231 [Candidatus Poriferisodalaceae bacterium]|jgi:hypothetical protein